MYNYSMSKYMRRVNYRLYPSKCQEQKLLSMLVRHQQLYNAALEQRIKAWRLSGVSVTYQQQAKDLTDLRAELPEYKDLNAQSSQNTLKRLDRAFQGFFRRLKQGEKAGFPRFKSIKRYSGWGYNTHGDGWRLFPGEKKHGYLRLTGVGHIRMRGVPRNQGDSKTLDILYKRGKWYASVVFACEPSREPKIDAVAICNDSCVVDSCRAKDPPIIKGAVGLDWGVETFATLAHDNGEYSRLENERHLRSALEQLRQLQQSMARKKRGSRNWQKLKKQVAALHAKIARKRHEFLHQTTAEVVKHNALIAVEKLNTRAMTARGGNRKKGLNREILSTAPGTFHNMLAYKAEEAGTRYVEIPTRKVKPSQTCSGCGHRQKKALSERKHSCSACGLLLSRDENAARVILNWALNDLKGREPALCGAKALAFAAKHETPAMLCGRHP